MPQACQLFTLSAFHTADLAALYPTITRSGNPLIFGRAYDLIGIQLSSSFQTTSGPAVTGVFVVANKKDAMLSISPSSNIIVGHTSGAGPTVVKNSWLNFDDYVIHIPAGSPISLYVCGQASASVPLVAVANIFAIPSS